MNPYAELEVPTNADDAQIKRAYRKNASKHHPDRGGDKEKFQAVKRGYEILSDPIARKRFDETGDTDAAVDTKTEAMGHLIAMVIGLVDSSPDIEQQDMHRRIAESIKVAAGSQRQTVSELRKNIKRLEGAKKRLRKKGDGVNLMARFIDGEIRRRTLNAARAEADIAMTDEMLRIWEEYEYNFELPTIVIRSWTGTSTSTLT